MSTKNNQKSTFGQNEINKVLSYKNITPLVKSFLIGVGITNETKETILEYIINFIENTSKNCYIVTPNPEMIVLSGANPRFKDILNEANIALCDGVGVYIACKILKIPISSRFTGVELVEDLCKKANDLPITVGFLGGREGVAERTVSCLQKKYPSLRVSYIGEEWKVNKDKGLIDILFVAFGFPKQEFWMSEQINLLPVRVMVGVGGAFDYISGRIPRAPFFIRMIGFEWLFRLIIQPWRIKRQVALFKFIFLIFKEKFISR